MTTGPNHPAQASTLGPSTGAGVQPGDHVAVTRAAAANAIRARDQRIAALEALAADMLSRFAAVTGDYCQAIVGEAQIARWRTVLDPYAGDGTEAERHPEAAGNDEGWPLEDGDE